MQRGKIEADTTTGETMIQTLDYASVPLTYRRDLVSNLEAYRRQLVDTRRHYTTGGTTRWGYDSIFILKDEDTLSLERG